MLCTHAKCILLITEFNVMKTFLKIMIHSLGSSRTLVLVSLLCSCLSFCGIGVFGLELPLIILSCTIHNGKANKYPKRHSAAHSRAKATRDDSFLLCAPRRMPYKVYGEIGTRSCLRNLIKNLSLLNFL
jgi:hypothetical protein